MFCRWGVLSVSSSDSFRRPGCAAPGRNLSSGVYWGGLRYCPGCRDGDIVAELERGAARSLGTREAIIGIWNEIDGAIDSRAMPESRRRPRATFQEGISGAAPGFQCRRRSGESG